MPTNLCNQTKPYLIRLSLVIFLLLFPCLFLQREGYHRYNMIRQTIIHSIYIRIYIYVLLKALKHKVLLIYSNCFSLAVSQCYPFCCHKRCGYTYPLSLRGCPETSLHGDSPMHRGPPYHTKRKPTTGEIFYVPKLLMNITTFLQFEQI